MKIIFTVLIFVAVATHADAKKRCYPLPTPVVDPPPNPPACEKHEVYSNCGANGCQATCENPKLPQVCRAVCTAGCVCEEGYLRNSKGKCVLAKNCPQINDPPVPVCKKAHEKYTICGSACPLTCEKPTPGVCTKQCVKGCFCESGYVRDNKGNCVLVEECPKPECGKNENYNDCGASPCQATCENPDLPRMCKAPCKPGCGCNEGYVRDNDGKCVLLKKCPQTLKCEDNEVYEACSTICGEPTCERSQAFFCGRGCQPKCLCKEGYVRNADNKCIKSKNCPAQCKSFEIFSDCAPEACKKTCDTLDTACKAPCVPGCKCPEGQVYLDSNRDKCVVPKKCPAILPPAPACNGAHESHSECGAYCQSTCGPATPCARPPQDCNPGCVCDAGYVRATHGGKCILEKKCPADINVNSCPGAHEIHNDCGTACPLTCENVNNPPMFCTANCVVGCFCESGYVRNSNGICVLPKNCPASPPAPACNGAHESYSECNAHCPRTCGPATACEAPLKDCNPGCVCDAGYVRATNGGKCILEKKCPK